MLAAAWEIILSTGPILRRELLGLLRTRKAFWMAVLTVAGTSLIPLLNWPADPTSAPLLHARSAFRTYEMVLFSALALFVPLVTATSITQEREQGTYELLLATRLRPGGIVLGKLLAAVGFFVLLLLLTFPVGLLLYFLGGFEMWDFLNTLLASLAAITFLGTGGICCSARRQESSGSIFQASGGSLILLAMVLISVIRPLPNLWLLWSWLLALCLMILPHAVRAADLPDAPLPQGQARGRRPPPLQKRPRASWPFSKILDRCETGVPDGWNPVLVASFRHDTFGLLSSPTVPLSAVVLTVLGALLMSLLHVEMAVAWLTGIPLLGMAVSLPAISATLLSGERAPGCLDLLRGTFLSSREIISGKLTASLLYGWVFLLCGGIYCLVLTPYLHWSRPPWIWVIVLFPLAFVAVALVSATAGLLASTLSRTGLQALVLSFVISLGYLVAAPLLIGYRAAVSRALSPLTGFFVLTHAPGRERTGSLALFLLSICAALLVAYLQFHLAVRVFEKRWMRER